MRTKFEIKKRLKECVERVDTSEGVYTTLVFDKVADLVLELLSEQVKQPSGANINPRKYFGEASEGVAKRKGFNSFADYIQTIPDRVQGLRVEEVAIKALTAQAQDHAHEMEAFARKQMMDFTPLVYELFNQLPLEHSQHGIACEKFAAIRNKFLNKNL